MGASHFLRQALRDVLGPVLREHGYRGTSPTWRKSSAAGDVTVINVQSSAFNSADEGACVVNLGVAPAPWIDREIATGHLVPAARDRLSAHDCPWTIDCMHIAKRTLMTSGGGTTATRPPRCWWSRRSSLRCDRAGFPLSTLFSTRMNCADASVRKTPAPKRYGKTRKRLMASCGALTAR